MLSLKRWEQQFLLMDGPKRRQFIFAVASRCLSNWPSQNTRPSSVRSLDHGKRWCRGGDSRMHRRRRLAQAHRTRSGSGPRLQRAPFGERREARGQAQRPCGSTAPRPNMRCRGGRAALAGHLLRSGPPRGARERSARTGASAGRASACRAVPWPARGAGAAAARVQD